MYAPRAPGIDFQTNRSTMLNGGNATVMATSALQQQQLQQQQHMMLGVGSKVGFVNQHQHQQQQQTRLAEQPQQQQQVTPRFSAPVPSVAPVKAQPQQPPVQQPVLYSAFGPQTTETLQQQQQQHPQRQYSVRTVAQTPVSTAPPAGPSSATMAAAASTLLRRPAMNSHHPQQQSQQQGGTGGGGPQPIFRTVAQMSSQQGGQKRGGGGGGDVTSRVSPRPEIEPSLPNPSSKAFAAGTSAASSSSSSKQSSPIITAQEIPQGLKVAMNSARNNSNSNANNQNIDINNENNILRSHSDATTSATAGGGGGVRVMSSRDELAATAAVGGMPTPAMLAPKGIIPLHASSSSSSSLTNEKKSSPVVVATRAVSSPPLIQAMKGSETTSNNNNNNAINVRVIGQPDNNSNHISDRISSSAPTLVEPRDEVEYVTERKKKNGPFSPSSSAVVAAAEDNERENQPDSSSNNSRFDIKNEEDNVQKEQESSNISRSSSWSSTAGGIAASSPSKRDAFSTETSMASQRVAAMRAEIRNELEKSEKKLSSKMGQRTNSFNSQSSSKSSSASIHDNQASAHQPDHHPLSTSHSSTSSSAAAPHLEDSTPGRSSNSNSRSNLASSSSSSLSIGSSRGKLKTSSSSDIDDKTAVLLAGVTLDAAMSALSLFPPIPAEEEQRVEINHDHHSASIASEHIVEHQHSESSSRPPLSPLKPENLAFSLHDSKVDSPSKQNTGRSLLHSSTSWGAGPKTPPLASADDNINFYYYDGVLHHQQQHLHSEERKWESTASSIPLFSDYNSAVDADDMKEKEEHHSHFAHPSSSSADESSSHHMNPSSAAAAAEEDLSPFHVRLRQQQQHYAQTSWASSSEWYMGTKTSPMTSHFAAAAPAPTQSPLATASSSSSKGKLDTAASPSLFRPKPFPAAAKVVLPAATATKVTTTKDSSSPKERPVDTTAVGNEIGQQQQQFHAHPPSSSSSISLLSNNNQPSATESVANALSTTRQQVAAAAAAAAATQKKEIREEESESASKPEEASAGDRVSWLLSTLDDYAARDEEMRKEEEEKANVEQKVNKEAAATFSSPSALSSQEAQEWDAKCAAAIAAATAAASRVGNVLAKIGSPKSGGATPTTPIIGASPSVAAATGSALESSPQAPLVFKSPLLVSPSIEPLGAPALSSAPLNLASNSDEKNDYYNNSYSGILAGSNVDIASQNQYLDSRPTSLDTATASANINDNSNKIMAENLAAQLEALKIRESNDQPTDAEEKEQEKEDDHHHHKASAGSWPMYADEYSSKPVENTPQPPSAKKSTPAASPWKERATENYFQARSQPSPFGPTTEQQQREREAAAAEESKVRYQKPPPSTPPAPPAQPASDFDPRIASSTGLEFLFGRTVSEKQQQQEQKQQQQEQSKPEKKPESGMKTPTKDAPYHLPHNRRTPHVYSMAGDQSAPRMDKTMPAQSLNFESARATKEDKSSTNNRSSSNNQKNNNTANKQRNSSDDDLSHLMRLGVEWPQFSRASMPPLVVGDLPTPSPQDEAKAETLALKASHLFKQAQYAAAALVYEDAARLNPVSSRHCANHAACLVMLQRWHEALPSSVRALALDARHLKSAVRALRCCLQLGLVEGAKDIINRYLVTSMPPELDTEVDALKSRTAKLSEQRERAADAMTSANHARAVVCLESALEVAAGSLELLAAKAAALLGSGRHAEAEKLCLSLLSQHPTNFDVLCTIARLKYIQGDMDAAVARLLAAAHAEPEAAVVRGSLRHIRAILQRKGKGNEAFQAGRYEEANRLYKEGLVLCNGTESKVVAAQLHTNRAAALMELGHVQEACTECTMALDNVPTFGKALLRRAKCELRLASWDDAIHSLHRVIHNSDATDALLKEARKMLAEAQKHAATVQEKDHYTVLGVQMQATEDEIKKSYKLLALKFHPDKNGGSDETRAKAERTFKEITEAYRVLSDPSSRRTYDLSRPIGSHFLSSSSASGGTSRHAPSTNYSTFSSTTTTSSSKHTNPPSSSTSTTSAAAGGGSSASSSAPRPASAASSRDGEGKWKAEDYAKWCRDWSARWGK